MSPTAFRDLPKHDRDYMMALEIEDRRKCKGCGTKEEDWDPEQGGNRHAFDASARVCWGCRAIEQHQAVKKAEAERQKSPLILRGLKFFLKPKERKIK